MSAMPALKVDFEAADAVYDGGNGDGRVRFTKGSIFLLSDEKRDTLVEYLGLAIAESQNLLKLRMTTGQPHDPNVSFQVFTENTGMVTFNITSADTVEKGLQKFMMAKMDKLNGNPHNLIF